MIKYQEFYFIRHGQTDWNLKHILMGSQNSVAQSQKYTLLDKHQGSHQSYLRTER